MEDKTVFTTELSYSAEPRIREIGNIPVLQNASATVT